MSSYIKPFLFSEGDDSYFEMIEAIENRKFENVRIAVIYILQIN